MLKIKDNYDVIIIGSGPSGSSCAIKCAQFGLKTLCVDNLPNSQNKIQMKGSFSNSGCLETVALLESAKLYDTVVNNLHSHGIYVDNVLLNLDEMMSRKDNILSSINQDIEKQFSKYNIDFINVKAMLLDSNKVQLTSSLHSLNKIIYSKNIILATESCPITIPCARVDNKHILDFQSSFSIHEVPKRIAILGASVIGLELAGIWNRLGAEIILLDAQELFLSLADNQISREAYKIFSDQGLELRLGARVISTKVINNKVHVEYQDSEGSHALRVDKLIVASGRKPNSDNLSAPEANLLLDENGFVHVNENCRTNLPGVYAIGDLTMLGPMLTHKGMAEGIFVAEHIVGIHSTPPNYNLIPNVIYTEPEIAWVGQTEQILKSIGDEIKVGVFPLQSNPKGKATNKTDGFVKIISNANTDAVLGVHAIASNASELIAEAVLAMEFSASSEDLTRTVHSHPSFTEIIREASRAIKNIHIN